MLGNPNIVNRSKMCCSSLDEARAGIDAIDAQLLSLLAQRCVFTHSLSLRVFLTSWNQLEPLLYAKLRAFKSTHDTVGVPSRDRQVVDDAMANATAFHSPQKIAKAVFTAIINTSVPFELCLVSAPGFYLCYAFSEYVPV